MVSVFKKVSKYAILLLVFIFLSFFSSFADTSKNRIVKIGVYLSMTGPIAAWGRVEWQGILIAHKMYPKVDGKKIELLLEDVGSKPEGAAMAAAKLVEEGVRFVIGPVASSSALAALPILEGAKVVDVVPTANAKNLVESRRFASRVCFGNALQARIMANYIYSGGRKSGVVIEDLSQDYSVDLAKEFVKYFKRYGGKIEKVFYINSSDTDFSALAVQIKGLRPQFIYFTTYYPSIALILRDLKMIGCKTSFFAGSAASSYALVKIAGKAADGLVFTDDFDPLIPQTKEAKEFIKLFKEKYGRMPDSPEALAADAYLLLVKGIAKEGFSPSKVAHYVRNTIFYGVTGKIIITKGKVKRTVVLREVKDGKFIPVAVFEP